MSFPPQRSSLFYLLLNYRLVPLERLIRALRYQVSREAQLHLSFSQILIAFNDLKPEQLLALREAFGELDEDPIGHLLLETGRLTARDLQRMRRKHPDGAIGLHLLREELIATGERECLFRELDSWCGNLTGHTVLEVLQRRSAAMKHFQQALWDSELISPEAFRALGLWNQEYLPKRFKPLYDALLLLGLFPAYKLSAIMVESCRMHEEPLLKLLCRPGLVEVNVMSRLLYYYDSQRDVGCNPAILLSQLRLATKGQMISAIQMAYHTLASERLSRVS